MITIDQLYSLYSETFAVSTDTRNCPVGCMFFALKGERFDGNLFAYKALENGAKYVVVDNPEVVEGDAYLLVNDVLKTLQELAGFHRERLAIPIIGITGTNGKTTTKELLYSVLIKRYKVVATKGNLNNHIGVPLTLLSMAPDTTLGIVEMGANHPGEIAELCNIAKPNYGLITNVGKAHLEGFGSFEGVKRTKAELYRHLEKVGGNIFVNGENISLLEMLNGTSGIFYGSQNEGFLRGELIQQEVMLSFKWRGEEDEKEFFVQTNLIGAYNFENAMAAVCVGKYFNVSNQDICDALGNYFPSNNRSQFVKTLSNEVIMDAYNANPTSMKKALENLDLMPQNTKVVVLGAMKELGEYSEYEHSVVVDYLSKMSLNRSILVGEEYSFAVDMGESFEYYGKYEELIENLHKNPIKDALVLVKGSRSNQLEKIMDLL